VLLFIIRVEVLEFTAECPGLVEQLPGGGAARSSGIPGRGRRRLLWCDAASVNGVQVPTGLPSLWLLGHTEGRIEPALDAAAYDYSNRHVASDLGSPK